jgi:hypothetical protein
MAIVRLRSLVNSLGRKVDLVGVCTLWKGVLLKQAFLNDLTCYELKYGKI